MATTRRAGPEFARLVAIIGRLRDPGGCPWDRRQDVRSITNYLLEEAYEAAEACLGGDAEAAEEELGDILMEVVFLARLYEERGRFSVADALRRINAKMIGRHPHVFAGELVRGANEVVDRWQTRKLAEKKRASVLDGLGGNVPALLASFQIGQRVSAAGFDWPDAAGAMDKVREELRELDEAAAGGRRPEIEEEIGDLFFALANVARHFKVNPELASRRANRKFSVRFRAVEERLRAEGKDPQRAGLDEMEALWQAVKKRRPAGKRRQGRRVGAKD